MFYPYGNGREYIFILKLFRHFKIQSMRERSNTSLTRRMLKRLEADELQNLADGNHFAAFENRCLEKQLRKGVLLMAVSSTSHLPTSQNSAQHIVGIQGIPTR